MIITIVGIQHNAFPTKEQLDAAIRPGDTLVLIKEELPTYGNPVAAMLGVKIVGRVSHDQVDSVKQLMGDSPIITARALTSDEKGHAMEVEIEAEGEATPPEVSHMLDEWNPMGPVLRYTDEENELRRNITLLEFYITRGMDYSEAFRSVMESYFIDLSGDSRVALFRVARILAEAGHRDDAAALQHALCSSGIELREQQFSRIRSLAYSPDMERLISFPPEAVDQLLTDLPRAFEGMYFDNDDSLISSLWYAMLPADKLRALITRLCLYWYLSESEPVNQPAAAPKELAFSEQWKEGMDELEKQEEPPVEDYFPYFTKRADAADRTEIIDELRALCRKEQKGNNSARLCRRLLYWERKGLLTNVFVNRSELYQSLLSLGFGWQEGSLKNAISKVLAER